MSDPSIGGPVAPSVEEQTVRAAEHGLRASLSRSYTLLEHKHDGSGFTEEGDGPYDIMASTWAELTPGTAPHPSMLTIRTDVDRPHILLNKVGYNGFQGRARSEISAAISMEKTISFKRFARPYDLPYSEHGRPVLRVPHIEMPDGDDPIEWSVSEPDDLERGYIFEEWRTGTLPPTSDSKHASRKLRRVAEGLDKHKASQYTLFDYASEALGSALEGGKSVLGELFHRSQSTLDGARRRLYASSPGSTTGSDP